MPKAITIFESDDGHRFESLAACEQYEANNKALYLRKLRDEIGYREVPLFDERKYGAYIVPPVTILTATPRSMHELETIAEIMRKDISDGMSSMPGFMRDPKTNQLHYTGAAEFPMVYSVMIERYRRRKNPIVKLFSGMEFSRLANLCTGSLTMSAPPEIHPVNITNPVGSYAAVSKRNPPRMIEYNGQSKTISEWGKEYNIDPAIIRTRLYSGWAVDRAITTPKMFRKSIRSQ